MEKFVINLSENSHSMKRVNLFENFLFELMNLNNIEKMKKKSEDQLQILKAIGELNIIKKAQNLKNFPKDEIASLILKQFDRSYKNFEPAKVASDGNCFYRSISKALYGVEAYYHEIKYRTIVELLLNIEKYSDYGYLGEDNLKWLKIFSRGPDSNDDAKKILEFVIIDSIKKNRWAGVYHFYAASNALKINIQPIFPTVDYGKATMSDANKFLNNLILCDGTSQGM